MFNARCPDCKYDATGRIMLTCAHHEVLLALVHLKWASIRAPEWDELYQARECLQAMLAKPPEERGQKHPLTVIDDRTEAQR
jgi:hypothetical protein